MSNLNLGLNRAGLGRLHHLERPTGSRGLELITRLLYLTQQVDAQLPANHDKPWSELEITRVQFLAHYGTPTWSISKALGRTEAAIRDIAAENGIKLGQPRRPLFPSAN